MPEIKTGNGIDRDFAATANDRMKKTVLELRNLGGGLNHHFSANLKLDGERVLIDSIPAASQSSSSF